MAISKIAACSLLAGSVPGRCGSSYKHPLGRFLLVLLPREADTGKPAWRGQSAVEILHGTLFLGEPQQLLSDRFDEGS